MARHPLQQNTQLTLNVSFYEDNTTPEYSLLAKIRA